MKKYCLFLICFLFAITTFTQQLILVDEFSSNYVRISDIDVNQCGTRFYNIENVSDSIIINGQLVQLLPEDPAFPFGREYSITVDANQGVYNVELFKADISILTDSSRLLFTSFNNDTLYVQDTFYINVANQWGTNLLLHKLRADDNSRVSVKQWFSEYDCQHLITDAFIYEDNIFISGEYWGNTGGLQLDDHFLDIGSGNGNTFVGAIDANNEVKWLKSVSGDNYQRGSMLRMNNKKHILQIGFSASSYIYFCEDSLENQAVIDWGTDFLWFVQFDTSGNCINKKTVDYYYGNIVPTSINSLSNGSYVVSGDYFAPFLGFDSTYLYSPVFENEIDNIGFLVKLDDNLNAQAVFQLEGSQGRKSIQSMIIDGSDNVLISGYAQVDTLILGDEILVNSTGGSSFGYLAILNAEFNVISAINLGDATIGRKLILGQDGNVYALAGYGTSFLQKLFRVDYSTNHGEDNFERKKGFEINIFPNPLNSDKRLQFELSNGLGNRITQVEVFDLFGRKIFSESINEQQGEIKINNTSGILFVVFQINDRIKIAKKIIVNY